MKNKNIKNRTGWDFFSPANHGKKFKPHKMRPKKWLVLDEYSDAVCDCGSREDDARVIAECLTRFSSNDLHHLEQN